MTRWILLVVLVVALSAAATVVFQVAPTSPAAQLFPGAGQAKASGPPPKAVVEGELTYKFGSMAQQVKGRHEWVIRNEGPGPLKLSKGPSTCSCTIATLKGDSDELTVAPGEEEVIVLEWETRMNDGHYSKGASILTNDPEHPQFDFGVEGIVRPAVVATAPGGLVDFRIISNEETNTQGIALFSPDIDNLTVEEIKTSKNLSAEVRPLTAEELKELGEGVESGCRVELTVTPEMPLGRFREEVIVTTNHPRQPKMTLMAEGNLTGPISFVPDRVQMLRVPGAQGGKEIVTVWVRGHEGTRFEVVRAPKNLKVAVAPADETSATGATGGAERFQMTVTVPPGTAAGLIDGQVVLKTDHPKAGEVKVPVSIFVTNS